MWARRLLPAVGVFVLGLANLMNLGNLAHAQSQEPVSPQLPPARDLLAPAIQGLLALNGNNAAFSGRLSGRPGTLFGDSRATIEGINLPFEVFRSESGDAWYGVAMLTRYTSHENGLADAYVYQSTNRLESWSLGLQGHINLGPRAYLQLGTQAMGSTFRNTWRLPDHPSREALGTLLDGKYVNFQVRASSLIGNINLGWKERFSAAVEAERPAGHWFVQAGYVPVWTRTDGVSDETQRFSQWSSTVRLQAGAEWPTDHGWKGKPVVLGVHATHFRFLANAEAFDGRHLNELGLRIVLANQERMGRSEGPGLSVGYVSGPAVSGWRLLISSPF